MKKHSNAIIYIIYHQCKISHMLDWELPQTRPVWIMLATKWTFAGHLADQFLRSGNAVKFSFTARILMVMWIIHFFL